MTWNLLTDSAAAAPPWSRRCPRVAARVAALAPMVMGTQEASATMLDDLVGELPGTYRWVGEGRRGGLADETCAVVYDSSTLTVLDVRHRWLSTTPEVPASQAPDAHLPRMLTAVRFHDSGSNCSFSVVNTHLDHVGAQARVDGAALAAGEMRAGPTVLMGDFNDAAGASPAYEIILRAGLRDTLTPRDRPVRRLATFVGVEPDPSHEGAQNDEGEQIDWLFVTSDVQVDDSWVDAAVPGTPMASDHRPVVADLSLPGPVAP